MAAIDKVKEEIGWLKVVFALLVAVDVSLMSWVTQNLNSGKSVLFALTLILAVLATWMIILINVHIYRMIKRLGGL